MNVQVGEAVLNRLHIKHYMHPISDGGIFFCKLPDGTAFDMCVKNEGIVRLWRLVRINMPVKTRRTYLVSNQKDKIVGFEVTDENFIEFFMEQRIHENWDADSCVEQQVTEFTRTICPH
jgi:hypothetical protein